MLLLPPGKKLHHYTIESVLGAGGFGVTYRAFDQRERCIVAIKEYFPRSASIRDAAGGVQVASAAQEQLFRWGLDRFVDEAQTLAQFRHPNIVTVLQYFGLLGTAYLVLEYVEGPSLEQWLATAAGNPSQEQCDGFATALLGALDTIHRNDILHRDIAPKNILIRADGSPVLIDFGSARQLVASRTMMLTAIVTPSYAPYEQYVASGQDQGPWTDIYAAAATLYRMLMSRPPPEAPLRALGDAPYEPVAKAVRGHYRSGFLEAIDWGLRTHPKDRPQSIAEWREPLLSGVLGPGGMLGLDAAKRFNRSTLQPLLDRIKDALRGGRPP